MYQVKKWTVIGEMTATFDTLQEAADFARANHYILDGERVGEVNNG